MPYDLSAVERGYGETVAAYNGNEILLRYRVDLDGRAMHAMRRAVVGSPVIGQPGLRIPDTEMVISELMRVLLPAGPDVSEHDRGWDLTRDGQPVPITDDELMRLPFDLPVLLLGQVMRDVQDPNRRRPSRNGSVPRASSEPTEFLTSSDSSKTPNGPVSLPGLSLDSPMPVGSGSAGEPGFGV